MSTTGVRPQEVRGGVRGGAEVRCHAVADEDELAAHFRIRSAVFVDEQGMFPESDRDEHDRAPGVVHVLAVVDGCQVGTVRLFPVPGRTGLWQGDRLAVLSQFRIHGAGAPLVRFAVAHAARTGGTRMIAHIQLPNVRFFERLGWSTTGQTEEYLGITHQPMGIDLAGAA